ncbi:SDR family oxidoreductase [Streptomyces sp. NPDC057307]|uniref:SDR family oxidoreductase n=1 Tax=Streptomyces sp. NPDC057307 TaxID=3346096 RepID=UPI0036253739
MSHDALSTALVTGGSRGIGRAVARRLGAEGALVALTYSSDESAAKETVNSIETEGGRAFAFRAELGVPGDADALWAEYDRLRDGGRVINVNAVSPGTVETDIHPWPADPAARAHAAAFSVFDVFDRVGQPADIADVVAFLAGPDSRWVTGQNIDVSGGSGL